MEPGVSVPFEPTEPVGLTEIARRLKVADQTVRQWAHRGVLPPPTWPKDVGRNLWQWGVIEQWAILNGRLPGVSAVLSCGHSRRVAPDTEDDETTGEQQ